MTTLAVDASTTQGCTELVELTLSRHRRIDVIVHTATVRAYGTLDQVPDDIFTSVVDTAMHGTARLTRSVLPELRRQQHGTLIVVNSLLGSVTVPGMGAYATAKRGQRAILRTLQQETLHDKGIDVCIVSPGSINTPIYDQAANFTGPAPRPPWPVLDPAQVTEVICGLADRPRRHVSVPVGPGNPLIVAGFRLLAPVYDLLVGPLFSLAALTATRPRTVPATCSSRNRTVRPNSAAGPSRGQRHRPAITMTGGEQAQRKLVDRALHRSGPATAAAATAAVRQ